MGRRFGRFSRGGTVGIQRKWRRGTPHAIKSQSLFTPNTPYVPRAQYLESYYDSYYDSYGGYEPVISTIYIRDKYETQQASNYPMRFNIRDRIIGTDPDKDSYEINLLNVQEDSNSARSQAWSADNQFVTMDNDGYLTYQPQGNFLRNHLILKFQVGDKRHPPTPQAEAQGSIYNVQQSGQQGSGSERQMGGTPLTGNPAEQTVVLGVDDDLSGETNFGDYWNYQGANGTCLLAAVGSLLESLGIEDAYEILLMRTTRAVDQHGNPIEPTEPVHIGQGVYLHLGENPYVIVQGEEGQGQRIILSDYSQDIFTDFVLDEIPEHLQEGYPPYIYVTEPLNPETFPYLSAEFLATYRVGTIMPNPRLSQNWGWVGTMFDAFNVETHTSYALSPGTILGQLNRGHGVIAYVDANELWNSTLLDHVVGSDAAGVPGLGDTNSIQNHAVWITDYEIIGGELYFRINDSGRFSGNQALYPAKALFESWEDAEFIMTGIGAEAPDQNLQELRNTLAGDIETGYQRELTIPEIRQLLNNFGQEEINITDLDNNLLTILRDPKSVAIVAKHIPLFKESAIAYRRGVWDNFVKEALAAGLTQEDIEELDLLFEVTDVE